MNKPNPPRHTPHHKAVSGAEAHPSFTSATLGKTGAPARDALPDEVTTKRAKVPALRSSLQVALECAVLKRLETGALVHLDQLCRNMKPFSRSAVLAAVDTLAEAEMVDLRSNHHGVYVRLLPVEELEGRP